MDPILAGILLGGGQAGHAIAGARKDAEDKARQASRDALLERQVLLQEQGAANERSDRETLATTAAADPSLAPFAPLLRVKGGDALVRVLSERAAKQAALDADRAERADLTRFVARAEGTPDTIQRSGALDLTANPEAAGTDALVPGQKPLDRTQRLAGLAAFKNVSPELYKRLAPEEKPDKFTTRNPEHDVLGPDGRVLIPGTPKPAEPKEGKTLEERVAAARLAHKRAPTPQTQAALEHAEESFRAAKDLAAAKVAPATPSPGEREDIANLSAARTSLVQVVASLKKPGGLGEVIGGALKNPQGALARTSEAYLGYGMNDEQRRSLGVLEIQLQNIKNALIGASRTRPELADIAAAIPDVKSLLTGDNAEQAIPKLEALLVDFDNKLSAREDVMAGSGVRVPPRQSAPKADAGRIPVVGPNGETGTVPAGTALPQGWKPR